MDNIEEIECWKILKRQKHSGKLVSCVVTYPAQMEYHEGVWNKADSRLSDIGYDICVFGSRSYAEKFFSAYYRRYNYCEFEMWRCLGRGLERPRVSWFNPSSLKKIVMRRLGSRFQALVDVLSNSSTTKVGCTFPTGTMMVKELMLVEKIEPEGIEVEP